MADPTPAAAALDYAPAPPGRRRVVRRALRLWPAWLLLMLASLGVAYGPRAWRHYRLLRLQAACLVADLPPARKPPDRGIRPRDPRWHALAARLGVADEGARHGNPPDETVFVHERRTPAGRRRLVVVEGQDLRVRVIEPATVVSAARVLNADAAVHVPPANRLLYFNDYGPYAIEPGRPDPGDPTRFTVHLTAGDHWGRCELEYRLGDDDTVTVRLLGAEYPPPRAAPAIGP